MGGTVQDARAALMASPEIGFRTWDSTSMIAEIPPCSYTGAHKNGEEAIFILEGTGYSIIDGVDGVTAEAARLLHGLDGRQVRKFMVHALAFHTETSLIPGKRASGMLVDAARQARGRAHQSGEAPMADMAAPRTARTGAWP